MGGAGGTEGKQGGRWAGARAKVERSKSAGTHLRATIHACTPMHASSPSASSDVVNCCYVRRGGRGAGARAKLPPACMRDTIHPHPCSPSASSDMMDIKTNSAPLHSALVLHIYLAGRLDNSVTYVYAL